MLRGADKRLLLTQGLNGVLAGRDMVRYPDAKPGRIAFPLPPVSGYVAWYDASDVSSLTISTGNLVTTWADKSASGYNAGIGVAGIAAIDPNKLNGLCCVYFDGSDFYGMSLTASDRTQTSFVVGMCNDLTAHRPLLGASNTGGNLFRIDQTTGRLNTIKEFTASLFNSSASMAVVAGTPFVAAQILSATTIEHRLNSFTPESTAESTAFTAALTAQIAHDPKGNNAYKGLIGEILVYDTALASGDVDLVMNYLKSKWTIS